MTANPYRGILRATPKGWGMYRDDVLLAYHEEEDVVRRWAEGKTDVEVRRIGKPKKEQEK